MDRVENAFKKHATSKIRVFDDLQNVKPLATWRSFTISSLSIKTENPSTTKDDNMGTRITVEGENELVIEG